MKFATHQFHALPGAVADGQADTRRLACSRPLSFSGKQAEQTVSRTGVGSDALIRNHAAPKQSAAKLEAAADMQERARAVDVEPAALFRFFTLAFVGAPIIAALAVWIAGGFR